MTVPEQQLEKPFPIAFDNGRQAQAVYVDPDGNAQKIVELLHLKKPRPAIFITGGADGMHPEDMKRTKEIIEQGVARFASENNITIIDGGTESGVMRMIGDAREHSRKDFPLIGVAPEGRVEYPGRPNPDKEADLENSHSHFVLVQANEWGKESNMIVKMTREISGHGTCPTLGILINGGRISQQDVYLATAKGKKEHRIPILVLEGSGRFADELANATRTGKTPQAIIKAIIDGGDIDLYPTIKGADALYDKLVERFK